MESAPTLSKIWLIDKVLQEDTPCIMTSHACLCLTVVVLPKLERAQCYFFVSTYTKLCRICFRFVNLNSYQIIILPQKHVLGSRNRCSILTSENAIRKSDVRVEQYGHYKTPGLMAKAIMWLGRGWAPWEGLQTCWWTDCSTCIVYMIWGIAWSGINIYLFAVTPRVYLLAR